MRFPCKGEGEEAPLPAHKIALLWRCGETGLPTSPVWGGRTEGPGGVLAQTLQDLGSIALRRTNPVGGHFGKQPVTERPDLLLAQRAFGIDDVVAGR